MQPILECFTLSKHTYYEPKGIKYCSCNIFMPYLFDVILYCTSLLCILNAIETNTISTEAFFFPCYYNLHFMIIGGDLG